MKRQADTQTLKFLFEKLCHKLDGYNITQYDNMTIFDFNYDQYTFTFKLTDTNIMLADNVDIYDEHENYLGNYNLEETFKTGIEE